MMYRNSLFLPLALALFSFSAQAASEEEPTCDRSETLAAMENSDGLRIRPYVEAVNTWVIEGTKSAALFGVSLAPPLTGLAIKRHVMSKFPIETKDVPVSASVKNLKEMVESFFNAINTAFFLYPVSTVSSKFQQGVFWLFDYAQPTSGGVMSSLEGQWVKTQGQYNVNEQMARNVIHGITMSIAGNIPLIRAAIKEKKNQEAAYEMAGAMWRAKVLFGDVDPRDTLVQQFVLERLGYDLKVPAVVKELAMARLKELDPAHVQNAKAVAHYEALYQTWFGGGEG
jgi:hypothetical protein